jgi:EAL domain-containing protein (putative c-di-GMP-specific phosphodiesterase class I)
MLRRLLGTGTESTPSAAELVPDAGTLEMLAADGVGLAQGFHIGHPRPVSELP